MAYQRLHYVTYDHTRPEQTPNAIKDISDIPRGKRPEAECRHMVLLLERLEL